MTNDWFAACRTLDEARAEYRRLCFVHHPDHGGDTLVMQAINVAYAQIQQALQQPRDSTRPRWKRPTPRPPSGHPNDGPPSAARTAQTEQQPTYSREYILHLWNHLAWQPLAQGGFARRLWQHQAIVFQHPDPKFERAWFVVLDNVFSPYFYATRREAEQAAFDLLYEQVKYHAE